MKSKLKLTSGIYAWGGPGTVRLLKTKYHQPQIDVESYLTLYDESRLKQAQQLFNLSDVWTTFSWGFSDTTEQEDYEFIIKRLKTFKKLRLRVHGYVQGFNVVTKEFKNQDIFCRDWTGHKQPYSKGRSLTCPCNPQAVKLIKERVERACQAGFDGVFVDNIIFGLPPSFVRLGLTPFFGCACVYCRKEFRKRWGYSLPRVFTSQQRLKEYVIFRAEVVNKVVAQLSQIAHQYNKLFGVNLFDPYQINPLLFQGYHIKHLAPFLDYLFIENHSLPSRSAQGNRHVQAMISEFQKPVVVISYDQGIGYESSYTQDDIDSIYSEAMELGYIPCFKVSEFTTHHQWHTLDYTRLVPVKQRQLQLPTFENELRPWQAARWWDWALVVLSNWLLVPVVTLFYENKLIYALAKHQHQKELRTWRNFSLEVELTESE